MALTLASGILFALALPNELTNWGSPLAGAVCIAPFLAACVLARSFRQAAGLGAIFGGLSTLLSSFWLMFFQEFAIWTLGGVVLAYVGFGALLGAILKGFAGIGGARYRVILLACAWTVYEYLKSSGFLGYPWGLVAYPVHNLVPLIQVADFAGVWGVSFIVAFWNSVAAELLVVLSSGPVPHVPSHLHSHLSASRPGALLRHAAFAALIAAACLVYGAIRLAERSPASRPFTLVLAQQSTDPWRPYEIEGILANQALSEAALEEARSAGAKADLVTWSETSLLYDPGAHPQWYRANPKASPFLPYLLRSATPHLIGAALEVDPENQEYMNGAVLMTPEGVVTERYGKQHPVPFAEAIPFWESQVVRDFFRSVVGIQLPWVMGKSAVVFELPSSRAGTVRFGAPICFEDAFSDLCRRFVRGGAEVLINLTNDSWSKTVSALTQHFVVARFRAVETRTWLVRATNGGVTAVVDRAGRIESMLPFFRPGYLVATLELPERRELTAYARVGDWFPLVLAAALIGTAGFSAFRRRENEGGPAGYSLML